MFARKPMRLISRASIEGLDIPVTDVKNSAPNLLGLESRMMQRAAQRLFSQLLRDFDPYIVRLTPVARNTSREAAPGGGPPRLRSGAVAPAFADFAAGRPNILAVVPEEISEIVIFRKRARGAGNFH